jgi:site-specific recombinase XerD
MNRRRAAAAIEHLSDHADEGPLERTLRLKDGTPLFMHGLVPADFWFSFGLHLARTHRGSTLNDYARIAYTFARFLESRTTTISQVVEADILEYRTRRTEIDDISDVSWKKDETVVQAVFDFAIHEGQRFDYPWMVEARRSALRQPVTSSPITRGLSEAEWGQFKQIGLLGRDLNGAPNPRFKTVWVMRNVAGAELALSTGLRVQEFSTLLLPEVTATTTPSGGAHLTLKSIAKRRRERTIVVPSGVLAHVQAYIRTDRAALVSHLGGRSRSRAQDLFIVDGWEPGCKALRGEIDGVRRSFEVKEMSPELRALTFSRTERGLEPLALFVNSWGRMTSKRTWHRVFKNASNFVASCPGTWSAAGDVHPHTLRHTFARRYLAYLRRASRSNDYQDEWGDLDEIVIVQRALGHSNLATTTKYLSGDSVSGVVEELFYLSTNTDKTYAEIIGQLLNERAAGLHD